MILKINYGWVILKKKILKLIVKLLKSNKSISRNFYLAKLQFLQFQKRPKINFSTGKKFKTAKNAISRKKIF